MKRMVNPTKAPQSSQKPRHPDRNLGYLPIHQELTDEPAPIIRAGFFRAEHGDPSRYGDDYQKESQNLRL